MKKGGFFSPKYSLLEHVQDLLENVLFSHCFADCFFFLLIIELQSKVEVVKCLSVKI